MSDSVKYAIYLSIPEIYCVKWYEFRIIMNYQVILLQFGVIQLFRADSPERLEKIHSS